MQASAAGGIEAAVAELKAALARDPDGFAGAFSSSASGIARQRRARAGGAATSLPAPRPPICAADATAGALLARLNEEIAALYGDDDAGGGDGGDDEYDDDGGDGDGGDFGDEYGGGEPGDDGPRVELPKGPRPYDLWRAAHEVERPAREVRGGQRRRVAARWRRPRRLRPPRALPSALALAPSPHAESGADVERVGRAGFAPERVVAAQAGALGAQARFAAPRAPPPSAQHSRASFASSRPPPPRFARRASCCARSTSRLRRSSPG